MNTAYKTYSKVIIAVPLVLATLGCLLFFLRL